MTVAVIMVAVITVAVITVAVITGMRVTTAANARRRRGGSVRAAEGQLR